MNEIHALDVDQWVIQLIAGESWMTHSIHVKGMDSFTTSAYVEGVEPLRRALTGRGHQVTHLPAHLVPAQFPGDSDSLSAFDVVVLSDIGANSIQLSPNVFEQGNRAMTGSARSGGGSVPAVASS